MADGLSHDQVQELLGARVLDALDDEERRQVDDHISGCEECRRALGRMERAAAAVIDGEDAPPPDVWERIKRHLREKPPEAS